jgi:uncharacterized membrane protein
MSSTPRYHRRMTVRLALAAGAGVVVGVGSAVLGLAPGAAVLLGVAAALLGYSIPLVVLFARLDEDETRHHFATVDPSRWETELLVIGGALAGLVAVGVLMAHGKSSVLEASLALLVVAAAWLAVHTTYTLRYAKHYLVVEPGCVDFEGSDDRPRLSDFAYLSFTLGMTYQVSDTDLRSPTVRRIVWGHTMLSYLFGTVIIASSINLLVSIAG